VTTALFAQEIESALLGCILEAPGLIDGVMDIEPKDVFHVSSNSTIFLHLLALRKKEASIDLPMLIHSLESSGELDRVGNVEYISRLVDGCVIGNFPSYVKTLRELALRRSLASDIERILARVMDASASPEQLSSDLQSISAAYRNGIAAERKIRFRTAAELATGTHSEVKWIAGRFVAAGVITLLVGKVKAAGKTTFLTHLAHAVVGGSPFLGSGTSRGPIVYLTEQSDPTFRSALGRAGLGGSENLLILTWSQVSRQPWPDVVRAAVTECKRIGAVLLIVDTIGQFTGLVGDAENNAGDALGAMQPLMQAAAEGLGVLVSQHERKSGGDVEDSGRGSSAFAGAADIVLNIRRRPGNGNANLRVLRALSRFEETPPEVTVEFTTKGYVLRDSQTMALDDAENAIMRIAPDSEGRAETVAQLCQAADIKRTTGQEVLTKLVEQGRILRAGSGRRGAPYKYFVAEIHSAGNTSLKRPNETEGPEDEFWRQQSNVGAHVCRQGITVIGSETVPEM
jgi:hypothetical protein